MIVVIKNNGNVNIFKSNYNPQKKLEISGKKFLTFFILRKRMKNLNHIYFGFDMNCKGVEYCFLDIF